MTPTPTPGQTLTRLYESDTQTAPDTPRTFVCLGVPRGGTSAVAGTMQRLGLFIGEGMDKNYEDPDFAAKPFDHMQRAVAARNKAHPVWGWKFPGAVNYLERLLPDLLNPHLVIVYRDVVATAHGQARRHDRTLQQGAHETLIHQQRNWMLMERLALPTAVVSYEKAMLEPAAFVRELAGFMALPVPRPRDIRALGKFLSPGRYK